MKPIEPFLSYRVCRDFRPEHLVNAYLWLCSPFGLGICLAGYGVITLISYFIGQKKYPVAYPLKRMTTYLILALVLYVLSQQTPIANLWLRLSYRTLLILVCGIYYQKDLPLRVFHLSTIFFK